MGSIGAMRKGSRDRYFQDDFELESGTSAAGKGMESWSRRASKDASPHKGSMADGHPPAGRRPPRRHGLLRRADHSATCSATRKFIRITHAGYRESHVHDVTITKESPNYRME